MKLAIDSDQNGAALKHALTTMLAEQRVDFVDLDYLRDNEEEYYPDVAYSLAKKIQEKQFDRGILICGTGLGMAMCANKVQGVFSGTCSDVYSAERLCKSNNAQVLSLGAQVIGVESAKLIVSAWLSSEYQGGRSAPKVKRMRQIEAESFG